MTITLSKADAERVKEALEHVKNEYAYAYETMKQMANPYILGGGFGKSHSEKKMSELRADQAFRSLNMVEKTITILTTALANQATPDAMQIRNDALEDAAIEIDGIKHAYDMSAVANRIRALKTMPQNGEIGLNCTKGEG